MCRWKTIPILASFWENRFSGFSTRSGKTGLGNHWRWLESWNFGFREKRDCALYAAKTKALISFAVTAKLICVFVFAYTKIRFPSDAVFAYTKIRLPSDAVFAFTKIRFPSDAVFANTKIRLPSDAAHLVLTLFVPIFDTWSSKIFFNLVCSYISGASCLKHR